MDRLRRDRVLPAIDKGRREIGPASSRISTLLAVAAGISRVRTGVRRFNQHPPLLVLPVAQPPVYARGIWPRAKSSSPMRQCARSFHAPARRSSRTSRYRRGLTRIPRDLPTDPHAPDHPPTVRQEGARARRTLTGRARMAAVQLC